MIVEKYCDRCGMEYDWAGVTLGDQIFCCTGCASGGPCTCPTLAGGTTVIDDDVVVVADEDVVVVR